jgi:hypothetical protein
MKSLLKGLFAWKTEGRMLSVLDEAKLETGNFKPPS